MILLELYIWIFLKRQNIIEFFKFMNILLCFVENIESSSILKTI